MRTIKQIIADAIENQGGNKSEIARKLHNEYSSQQLGQYIAGSKEPKLPFYFKWKEVFGQDLIKEIETNVSNDGEDRSRQEIQDPWQEKYIQMLEEDKAYFKDLIKSSLAGVREDIRIISSRQKGTGDVLLNSLERLEKKKKGELVREADKRIFQIDKEARKRGNADVPHN